MSEQLRLFADEVETLTAYEPLWVDGTPIQKGSQKWGAQIIKTASPGDGRRRLDASTLIHSPTIMVIP